MIRLILHFHQQGLAAIEQGIETAELFKLPVREDIARARYLPNDEIDKITAIQDKINEQVKAVIAVAAVG
jgi:V/A-type H+-transporting ATPase subunit A